MIFFVILDPLRANWRLTCAQMTNAKRLSIVSDLSKLTWIDIWRACKYGNLDLVRNLLRGGQNVNEQTQSLKNTPLHIAAKHGHLLIVKYLIEHGA